LIEEFNEKLEEFAKEQSLSKKEKEEIRKIFEKILHESSVLPFEPVGLVASQSIGEPGTQLTLRTKHFAGALEVSISTGIDRAEEIADARKTTKYKTMTIHLKKEILDKQKDKVKFVQEFANSLVYITLKDIAKIEENLMERKILVVPNDFEMERLHVNKEDAFRKIAAKIEESKIFDLKNVGEVIEFTFPEGTSYLKVRKELKSLQNLHLYGIKGIERVTISLEEGDFVIKTTGSNLRKILSLPEVDGERVTTNDIMEIYELFGIEAARYAIAKELNKIYGERVSEDARHVLILADAMCFTGELKGVTRNGIIALKKSPLARATFEQTIHHLIKAAFKREEDFLRGVVENIFALKPVSAGTGRVELQFDEDLHAEELRKRKTEKIEKESET
jgi:DNA-directed RNA polymerase subunit A"